ncbi:MAG: PilZ domain-containing protein [Gammaproteobacteria bacterium]|nr:PilZ domain-containing protein [Gammaproteobacteria bacterium]
MADDKKASDLPAARQGILSLAIKDKGALYSAYIPFMKHGGIFIPTNKPYKLEDEVFILLTLMDETEKMPVVGRVAWINPKGSPTHAVPGIGVQFADDKDSKAARNKIEAYLGGALKSDRLTHTM